MKVPKPVFSLVEYELMNYDRTRRELSAYIEGVALSTPLLKERVQGGPTSDPTARAVIKVRSSRRVQQMENIIMSITDVMRGFSEEQVLFYDQFYRLRKDKYYIMDLQELSKSKFYRIRQGIVEAVAVEMGLVDVGG